MTLSFESKAKLGYATLALLLVVGLVLSVRRLAALTDVQIGYLRGEENELTLVERLRWNAELIVSHGRGYLISADASLLARVQEAEARFDNNVAALRGQTLSAEGNALVANAQEAANRFRAVQESLLDVRQTSRDGEGVVRRFETELRPLRTELGQTLDRLAAYKGAALARTYDEAKRNRRSLERQLYGLLGVLLLISLGIAWYFARLLGRSYRKERTALEAARKAVTARDELLGIVAHDLRNPLGAITLKAGLMKSTDASAEVREGAESIQNVAMRMEYLIKSMLDATTMGTGQFSVTREPCAVEELVGETLDLFSNVAASKQIHLEADVSYDGLVIHADRDRVLQVLSNLVGNALKFTPQGGEVKIRIEREQDVARFSISDTGPGIAAGDIPRLFDRFWKRAGGTGLGLFIAKGIVEAHGGRIWVRSQPSRGSIFYFELPLVAAGHATPTPIELAGAHAHP